MNKGRVSMKRIVNAFGKLDCGKRAYAVFAPCATTAIALRLRVGRVTIHLSGIPKLLALLVLALLVVGPCVAQAPSSGPPDFKFTKVDLKLLEEVNGFDRQLTKKGVVLQDGELSAYLEGVGKHLLGNQPAAERVNFKFRALRDPMISAFALPNGSIYANTGLLAVLENQGELASVLGNPHKQRGLRCQRQLFWYLAGHPGYLSNFSRQ
jgi:hypothetical protein